VLELRTRFLNMELYPTPNLVGVFNNVPQNEINQVFQSKWIAERFSVDHQ
jgi:hypothetical protein